MHSADTDRCRRCNRLCCGVYKVSRVQSDHEKFQQGLAAVEADDYSSALAILLPLAEAGNPEAQAYVGFLYTDSFYRFPKPDDEDGWSRLSREEMAIWEEVDNLEAIKWLTKASNQGIGPATNNLAMLIWSHPGTLTEEEARAKAKVMLRKAWEQGCRVFAFSADDVQDYLSSGPGLPAASQCSAPDTGTRPSTPL